MVWGIKSVLAPLRPSHGPQATLLAAFALSGCSVFDLAYEAKQHCENKLIASLEASVRYERRSIQAFANENGNQGYVSIRYVAKGTNGATTEETGGCVYRMENHKWPSADKLEIDLQAGP